MKPIKHINITPDAVGSLCTIFYADNTKLSVTLQNIPPGKPVVASMVLAAVVEQIGDSSWKKNGEFLMEFNRALHGLELPYPELTNLMLKTGGAQ